jgi:hypothetical protein
MFIIIMLQLFRSSKFFTRSCINCTNNTAEKVGSRNTVPDPTRKGYFGSDQVKKVLDPDSQRKKKGIQGDSTEYPYEGLLCRKERRES